MKTTKKDLELLLSELAKLTGKSTSKQDAITKGQDKYLYLEYASVYGGWRLVNVGVSNGAHYGAFGGNGCEGRISSKEMYIKLNSLIAGAEYAKR